MTGPRPLAITAAKPIAAKPGWRARLVTAVAWSAFVGFHAAALLYFGVSSYFYWALRGSGTSQFLAIYRIGISPDHYRAITIAYGSIAVINLGLLLNMAVLSVRRRRFIFVDQLVRAKPARKDQSIAHAVARTLLLVYEALFSSSGFFGVSGPCFDLLLLFRELLETALQTVQAYRMSQYLARAWINRFYVGLLVLNCWLMALVHTLSHRSPTTRYFVAMLFDLILDFVSSIVVPVVLIGIYARDADIDTPSVFGLKWYMNEWLINAENEFQIILVTSWADLASRLLFALSMVGTLNTLKRFVSHLTDNTSKHGWRHRWSSIVPEGSIGETHSGRTNSARQVLSRANNVVKNARLIQIQRITFAVWGTTVLALHLNSEMAQDVPECVMQVRPWGISRPSCNLVLVNCYEDGIAGNAAEIHERLDGLHPPSIINLFIRHCPSIEMPSIIQAFPNLSNLKFYNSTIVKWDQDAALTKGTHPHFSILLLVRVRMADSQIPLGLQADDFPPTTNVFGFLDTNIRSIPDDLDSKWATGSIIQFDTAELAEVPDVLLRLKPYSLELAANPIQTVPSELFEIVGNRYIGLSYTEISELPDNVTTPSAILSSFNLDGTNISSFPAWVDEWLTLPGDGMYPERISASGSPYCEERGRVFSGELVAFMSPTASRLMDASSGNWEYLKRGVSCAPTPMYRYPIWMEDMFYAMG